VTNELDTLLLQRILALTTAIWLNDQTAAQTHRSLTAYDH
jgi:hypothetical protein